METTTLSQNIALRNMRTCRHFFTVIEENDFTCSIEEMSTEFRISLSRIAWTRYKLSLQQSTEEADKLYIELLQNLNVKIGEVHIMLDGAIAEFDVELIEPSTKDKRWKMKVTTADEKSAVFSYCCDDMDCEELSIAEYAEFVPELSNCSTEQELCKAFLYHVITKSYSPEGINLNALIID